VSTDFHARYAARSRTYRYVLLNRAVRPAAEHTRAGWFHGPLDVERMQAAARLLLGEHDFSAFRAAECQARTPVRTLVRLDVVRRGDYVIFDACANAFLHHMVRNIVGSLVYVGKGAQPPEWLAALLASRDRARAAPTFEAAGLYLSAVEYEARWGLPVAPHSRFEELLSGG
jgi:tRNA pseudouridine38-40 synthase